MRFSTVFALLPLIGAAFAQTNHVVQVGPNGTLTYSPSELTVASGDTVSFQFLSKNHTVTQSTFASPCSNMTNADGTPGVDSGFQFVANGTTTFQQWTITINNASAPMWFYCRQATPVSHCQKGMVFALNPTAQKSFAAFQAAAMATTAANTTTGTTSNTTTGSTGTTGSTTASGTDASPSAVTTGSASSASHIKAGGTAGVLLAGVAVVAGLVL
ncbi:Cupredoxin [Abortiporus biennis]|nr:Cupredoxin [Abortiporus biennis]